MLTVLKLFKKPFSAVFPRVDYSAQVPQCNEEQEGPVIVKKLGSVTTIGINRPEKCNAIDYKTANMLADAITQFEEDKGALVGVLYGTGGNFCAGFDLKEMAESTEKAQRLTKLRLTDRYVLKPLIAAVSGYAYGVGFNLALWCDLRVVEDTAVLGCLQRRFGITQTEGNLERLVRSVGLARSLDWVLTGKQIKAKEAFDAGIVSRLVACGTSLGQAVNLAQSVSKFPPSCMAADRAGIYLRCINEDNLQIGLASTQREHFLGLSVKEAEDGAKKFVAGVGRKGKTTSLTEHENKNKM